MTYALIEEGASYAEWQIACEALNKVPFTAEDAEEGFDLIRFAQVDQIALDRFTTRFQDVAPEMVVASLHARFNLVAEAEECNIDLKSSSPSVYANMLTGPLFPEDFGVYRDTQH